MLRDDDFAAALHFHIQGFAPVQSRSIDIDTLQAASESMTACHAVKMGGKSTPPGGKEFDHKEWDHLPIIIRYAHPQTRQVGQVDITKPPLPTNLNLRHVFGDYPSSTEQARLAF
jgi:hypothetical protein